MVTVEQAKKIGVTLAVVVAGVLIALKVKEQMDKSKLAAPIKQ